MGLMQHIALALDFSEPSRTAARAIFQIARHVGAEKITVLHSVQQVVLPSTGHSMEREKLESLQQRIRDAAAKELSTMCSQLGAGHVATQCEIVTGAPAVAIPEGAARLGATLLALGTHSRRGLRRLLSGSVAEAVCRDLKIPALVLPTGSDGIPPDVELADVKSVLIAVDLFEETEEVVRVGVEAARAFAPDVQITLLFVSDLPQLPDTAMSGVAELKLALFESANARLEALRSASADAGANILTRVTEGEADVRILEVASEIEARLIVVGTHGRGSAPLLELGSTTADVLSRSPVSVLVVPSHPERSGP